MPRVYNKYHKDAPVDAVYIGRPSPWGNPFAMSKVVSRDEALVKFKEWIKTQPELIEKIKRELKGKDLVCFCHPKPCHGDVLIEIANS